MLLPLTPLAPFASLAACAAEATPGPMTPAVLASNVVEVAPPEEPAVGEISACPPGSHPVVDLCVADGRPIPKWEPSGNGDPCASYSRPERGLENCDPQNTGDPDMDHERGAILRTIADTKVELAACRTPKGPHGAGHVEITFSMNGKATAARAVDAPYEGTPTGACVAARFRTLKVPDFKKKPSITVVIAFAIE